MLIPKLVNSERTKTASVSQNLVVYVQIDAKLLFRNALMKENKPWIIFGWPVLVIQLHIYSVSMMMTFTFKVRSSSKTMVEYKYNSISVLTIKTQI